MCVKEARAGPLFPTQTTLRVLAGGAATRVGRRSGACWYLESPTAVPADPNWPRVLAARSGTPQPSGRWTLVAAPAVRPVGGGFLGLLVLWFPSLKTTQSLLWTLSLVSGFNLGTLSWGLCPFPSLKYRDHR